MPSSEKPPPSLPEDNAKPTDYVEAFKNRPVASKFIDPCAAAHKASMDCLSRNDYEREKCFDYFQAYRDCKKLWVDQRKKDRQEGRPSA